ncbi:MAG TPA: hypothetical protein VKN99_27535 [Polyangia bacterium]|nr:hypothetical protein [Polyangia bacterium]
MRKTSFLGRGRLSRREFARTASYLAASAALLPAAASLQPRSARAQQPPSPTPAVPKLSAAGQAEVEAKLAAIIRKYGDRLSAADKTELRRLLSQTQEGLTKLRAFPLDNPDEPATVFLAARARGE